MQPTAFAASEAMFGLSAGTGVHGPICQARGALAAAMRTPPGDSRSGLSLVLPLVLPARSQPIAVECEGDALRATRGVARPRQGAANADLG